MKKPVSDLFSFEFIKNLVAQSIIEYLSKFTNPSTLSLSKTRDYFALKLKEVNDKIEKKNVNDYVLKEGALTKAIRDICVNLHDVVCAFRPEIVSSAEYITVIRNDGFFLIPVKHLEGLNIGLLSEASLSAIKKMKQQNKIA